MTRISAAESQVMEALWAEGPMGAEEIVTTLSRTQEWGGATVKTLINRLLKKKALVSERVDGRTRYRPLISRADYVTGESQGLLDRLFDGRLAPLVSHLSQSRKLSAEDIAELKKLIEEMKP